MLYHNTKNVGHFLLLASMIVINVMADSSKDKEECTQQLLGLATCVPYVDGEAKAPAPDCCSGLKQVLKSNKKCLCLIIKDRNDPDLGGIQINVSLALNLPTVCICNSPANISKCPELLHMDPKSKEAQVFYQLNKGSNNSGLSPAPSPSDGASSAGSQANEKNGAISKKKRIFGLDVVLAAGLLVWFLFGCDAGNSST